MTNCRLGARPSPGRLGLPCADLDDDRDPARLPISATPPTATVAHPLCFFVGDAPSQAYEASAQQGGIFAPFFLA